MLSGIAAFQMRRAVFAVRDDTVMLVSRETVVVLRMIVVVVEVSVQQGQRGRRRDQRGNEQQRQRAVHNDESMRRGQPGSKSIRTFDSELVLIGSRPSLRASAAPM